MNLKSLSPLKRDDRSKKSETDSIADLCLCEGSTLEEEHGVSLVEYTLLTALIAMVSILAVRFAGERISQRFSSIGSKI